MSIAQELERLAKLRAEGALSEEEFTKAKKQVLSASGASDMPFRSVRRQSSRTFCGLPLWAIAVGPDFERWEMRGHARAIFAFGDIATGWLACGGFARGLIAVGGGAVGVIALGGGAAGLVAVGGGAVGGLAFGGAAIGGVAVGGGAVGYYAMGGGAVGVHTISATHQDPAAQDFFQRYLPCLARLFQR